MTPYKNLRNFYFIILALIWCGCSATKAGLTRKRIVMHENRTHVYVMWIPRGYIALSRIFSAHGLGFSIQYPDNTFIYYTEDVQTPPPGYFDNFKIAQPRSDTSIGGQQENGRYWKEISHQYFYIGYKNVLKNEVPLFDKSLETFEQKK